jgi:signal transduction histidine kinase
MLEKGRGDESANHFDLWFRVSFGEKMIKTKFFRRNYFILVGITFIFILIGFLLAQFAIHSVTKPGGPGGPMPGAFFARMIDGLSPLPPISAIEKIESWNKDHSHEKFFLLNENGTVLYPVGEEISFDWKLAEKLKEPYQEEIIGEERQFEGQLVRLNQDPPVFLLVKIGPPPNFFPIFAISTSSLFVSVLLGIGVALFSLLRSLQDNVLLADSVISELKRGNLKARFPIQKVDEVGKAMSRFNQMADEIERLVSQLKDAEESRMSLLQELAHDLRTPIASLKHLLETFQGDRESLSEELKKELMSLALREVEYFERLVEDLLVLAQVNEPRYRADRKAVSFTDLLNDELDGVSAQYESEKKTVQVNRNISSQEVLLTGDAHLLRRMLRNALDNAFSFARSSVNITMSPSCGSAIITIEDDGPGFSSEALSGYGERRVTRLLSTQEDNSSKRVSVGLGSVIIKTVARLHRGEVEVENGDTCGARVLLRIPVA